MHNEEIGNRAAYTSMLEQVRDELGEGLYEIAEMLSHGLTKRKVAKLLNVPYPELKKKVLLLKKFIAQEYYTGGKDGGKKGRKTLKKKNVRL
jgi:hypothetical protein